MKLKQSIFALVAMLSFTFSAFAQTTVSSQTDLETALGNGGEVTLGGNITVSRPVTIPNGAEVVLNLNGKTLKAANAKTKVLENQGKLTINGQGTVSGIIYNGTASGSDAEMTLNGGTYNLDGINGGLHHYGKTLTINDDVVVKTTSYGVRLSGKKSVLNLYGGTYTSTGSGDMARPLALSNGTVNFLDSDITVNGYMHVMVGQVTVNFGENNQYSPFEAYHQGNSYASSVFYCKTLAEAISRTGFAAVTLVKNVKVAADAPITVNKEIDLNLNGKNLSATNAKTTVLKNYANLTIKGKGTVTGLVYNGDAENKGFAEMTLNGGTYKLDGANGGFFNYGKTLTVNDGVTISSQVYGLRMSNAESVINLYGGTFTSTNPTDNMKRAIAVDAGTINFNDDDITINGYFHANRSKAKVNFGEYCPFDAFMYSARNAGGYYVVNLENAIDKADAGFEIVLQKNIERSEIVTLPKNVTLDGNGKTLTSTAGRAINVDCADVVTIENLTIAGATGCERGINIINKAGTTNLKKVNVSGVSYYAVHVATSAGAAQVNIENSNLTGWAAVAAYGENGTINVKNSNLVGINNYTGNSDNFATVAAGSNVTVNVTGGKVTAESSEGKADQAIVCAQSSVENAKFTLDAELELKGTAEFVNIDLDKNKVTVREVYGTNYVTTPAGNGLVTLTGASEAMIGDVKYSTIAQAFAAAKEGETITLIADVTLAKEYGTARPTLASTIDLGDKTLTLADAKGDIRFNTLTFKNGTIVVDPSVKANTAVFWLFENQTLTFDNVDIVATGVTGTYLIGINGGTGTTVDIINGSSITINNESEAKLTAVICDNGTGNTVTIKGSDIDVKNIEGRFYLGGAKGKITVENSDIDLNGVKEGFYLRAGQSLDIAGKSTVDVVLNSTEGRYGINVTDATAKYTKAETATVNATVFEKKGGNDFNGYTGADRIWGETWGNAKESFVIKVLDANGNVMGTSSLNNINGIIDGDVTVTWSILFDAPTPNPAAYWSMEWTTAPSISNMPAKVELWVDGTRVSGGSVVLNGPDDLDKIVAAVTDADGKILSCHTSVASAAANNATNIALLRETTEEISLPVGTILNKNGFNADNVTVKQPVVSINDKQFATFAEALAAVENGQTITLIQGVTGDEKSTEIEFTKDIKFTITGKAPQYALPVVTFQNAKVTFKDAEILIPELDARQNAVINVVNSTVHDAGGNSIAKSYYNGTINIDKTSTVYMMQITTMGYINVAGTVNATWQTNVYGNGMISLAQGAKFNTAALHLTGKDYSNRDNTDTDRVGKPATIVVDGATLNVGKVKSDNGSDYSYNSSKGINVGTVDGKLALLDVKNGGAVNFHMANGQTTNFGAGATVNVAASTLKTISRDENGTVKLANNGKVVVTGTGNSQLDVKNYSGNAIQLNNGNLVDTYFAGRVDAFGTNNISGTSVIGGILSLGYGTNPTEQVVVNITGNFNGTNVLVYTNNGVDNILNVGKADGERTKAHFAQLGAFADVNVVNADVTYGYAFVRNDFNATNSTFEIKDGVNTYFSGNAKVVLDNTTWALPGYANIGSYGGYMYGNADVTLKNGSSMTATSLGVEVSGENVVKLTLEDNSSLTATKLTNQGSIVLASTEATLTSNECANVTTSVPNQVVSYIDGKYTLVAAIAQIGGTAYTSLQAAINAVKDGETITLVDNVTGSITLTEKVGLHYTIDGAGKTMNGKITITPLSDENDNRRITIKGINFVNTADAAVDFISCAVTNHYPRLTVEGCTFTGNGKNTDVALRLKTAYSAVIKDCTGTGLHSFLQNTAGKNFTIENVRVTESKGAFALGTVQGVTIKGSTIDVATYGIRLDANTYNNNAVIEGNEVTAFIPVVVRSVNTQSNVTFTGENTFTAENTDDKWMVIGTTEYEAGVALPAEVATGNVVVALNGTNLSYDGIHGAGLAGEGTADEPYLINNVAELEIFRNSVNAGSAKYSKPGLCVALGADIDMTGVNWVGIGSATADHGFMGNFDGKNFKIKNLIITNPTLDSDGYAYAGLFGVTEGTDKDNQNVIKNLTIENVTINTTGHIAAAAIAYPYYTNVDNVKVCGNIAITGGNYTAGVLAYTRRCVNASNLAIVGKAGSFVKGNQTVGGVISDIQMNGGLTAVYSNFSAEGITVTGEKSVGGIAGIIATQTLNGAAVKNVTLDSKDEFAGVVAGRLGGTSTISNVVSENVTGATAVIGATFDGAKAVEARIGDTYYSTFAATYTAANAGETVTMLVDLNMSEILVLDKAITLDGNGKKLTSTAGRAINVDCEGNVGIKNLIINASGERAINVIQKPANVTIENVTATAANYTVNLASSAGAAKVAISNSNLTGLNVVNVAAAGSEVTINGGTITCNDQNANENYAALTMNKDAVGAKIAATGVTFNINGDSKKASNGAVGGVITIDGSTAEVAVNVAYISYGNNYYSYTSIEAAIEAAKAGETIGLVRDITASAIITIDKAITLDGNGKTLTSTAGRAINVSGADGVTIKNLTIDAKGERAINVIQSATNVTIDGVTATAKNYTVNVAASAPNAVVAIKNSTLNGLCTVNVSAAGANVTVDNSTVNCNDNNTTAGEAYAALSLNKEAVGGSIIATNSTINVTDGSDSMKGRNGAENGTVTIDGKTDGVAVMVAIIEYAGSDNYHAFATIDAAINFAKAGETIKLLSNVTVANKIVINKSIALDGNGKTLTYTGTDRAIEMPNVAGADYDVTIKNLNVVATTANRGLNYNDNGKLNVEGVTVTIGENVDGYAINFPGMADGAQVTIKNSKLTSRNPLNIWGENMTINVHNSEITSVDNSTTYDYAAIQLNNDNYGNVANGTVVNVYGGTITALNDKGEPSNVVANSTETGVVNISDETVTTGKVLNYVANIGGAYFGSLQAAVNAIEKYGYNSPIVIMKDFATSEATTIKSGLKVTINLNGKTITGTDNETKSYGLININPGAELTINGDGAIKLTATNNREWNAYSSVISNQRGKLTVNGGTIEHLGGTDMAYAIDNLTNGKGTYAETIINGGTIVSTYRAIRQFLNGTEAQNILTVNGGTIEGTNKSIWMQDANKSANPGALTVAGNAAIKGDVYLFVTAGSTEWPVSVSIAAAALQGESKVVTGNVPAGYDVAEVNGAYGVYTGVAKIGTAYYATIAEAISAAQEGDVVTILAGEYTQNLDVKKAITVVGQTDAEGNNLVKFNGKLNITANGAAVKNITVKNSGTAAYINAADVLVENCNLEGSNGLYQSYAKGTVTFKNSVITGGTYGVHFDGSTGGNIVIEGCTITGWTSFAGSIADVAISKTTFADGNYDQLRFYQNATLTECVFNENMTVDFGKNTIEAEFNQCTVENGKPLTDVIYLGDIAEGVKVTIDNEPITVQAKVGNKYYQTLLEAVNAAKTGETVKLLADVNIDTKNCVTCGGYSSIFNVKGIELTFDLNGHTITVDADPADFTNAKQNMLMGVFTIDDGGKLTIDNSSEAKTGAVNVSANGATVYSLAAAYGKDAKLTINNGSYFVDEMIGATSLIYAQHSECVIINGGTYNIGNVGTGANGSPWIFNTKGQNMDGIYVYGGTYPTDINHEFWFNEAVVPGNLAVKKNENGTWSIVEAVAYTNEKGHSTGSWRRNVGYATIEEAIAATQTRNCEGNVVTMIQDITLTQSIEINDGMDVTIEGAGKTITGCDGQDVFYVKGGKLTLTEGLNVHATTDCAIYLRGGDVFTAANLTKSGDKYHVIQGNGNYAGNVTITGGKVEHQSNNTAIYWPQNGKLTITGGEITGHSAVYIASGSLEITGGTLHGVGANGGYSGVTGGSTDAPAEALTIENVGGNSGYELISSVEITGGTFISENTKAVGSYANTTLNPDAKPVVGFITGGTFNTNVDEYVLHPYFSCFEIENGNGYIVERIAYDNFTIVDSDYEGKEFTNTREISVFGDLTYERYFDDTEWQTIVLPFDVPVANLMEQFEVAYIYNASYKTVNGKKVANIDYVVIEENSPVETLRANYPYMIRAKEADYKSIVVKNAKLMPTKVEILDCSSIFEKFSFIGNYATVDASDFETKYGYFNLTSGAWNKMETINPFRFYMQIEKRDGNDFEYSDSADGSEIRMRQVGANGEATGVDSVGGSQNADVIFDIHGRRVLEPQKGGIYIINGKKVVF